MEGLGRKGNKAGEINKRKVKNEKYGEKGERGMTGGERKSVRREHGEEKD